ncbi:MAG: 50S ribosomal protein L4 [Proteobacteria bacterium]|nr:50S ribosomal protein L4 [Pseudomonadota bacterium]
MSENTINWDVVDVQGSPVGTVELLRSVFAVPLNAHVLQSVITSYRANRRQGTHATKTRSLVSGSGKKPFKQKGTGRARQGTSRAPHMKHGAVAHGPQPRSYRQHINQKTKQLSLKVALSDKVRHKKLLVLSEFPLDGYSTKLVFQSLNSLLSRLHVLILDARDDDFLYKSSRNIYGADVVPCHQVNAEHVIAREHLIMTRPALDLIQKRFHVGGV